MGLLHQVVEDRIAVDATLHGNPLIGQPGLALLVLHLQKLSIALWATLLAEHGHLSCVVEDPDDDITLVANQFPLGHGGGVKN